MESLIGKNISRYRIVEKLGQGGMGVVYKAEDSSLKRLVALKFLPGNLDENPERKVRFLREAQMAAALDHPNIATVYDVFEDEQYAFISMAFVEGVTLKQRILSGPVDVHTALHISIQIAEGLAAAHDKGIIHRDIKSANIILQPDGRVKITDFGLAKLKGDSGITKTGTQVGTAAYMSPEQIQGKPADLRSDIFSLGITIYEMLTGEFPFSGENDQAVMFSILYDMPAPLENHMSDPPQVLESILQKMLAKNPEDRYQDVHEIIRDLQAVRDGRPLPGAEASGESPRPAVAGASREEHPALRLLKKPEVLILLALAAITIGYYFFAKSGEIPFQSRDWILVSDFKNQTDEPLFDRSLNTALAVSIGQSPYVNVFPRRRIKETLRRMKTDINRAIDDSLAREVALREGISVLLLPSISRVGSQYVLTAELQDAATAKIYTSEIVYAQNTDEVLTALDELTRRIRRRLGETVASVSKRSRELIHVTTASLEALRQYSYADQLKRQAKFAEARSYYENALEIDSSFTAARAALGILHVERAGQEPGFDRDTGVALLKKAVVRADSLTDVEKYGILAYYAQIVENDLPKAADYHKALLAIHPDLSNVHNNLAIVYRDMGKITEAVEEFKTAISLDPSLMLAYNGLNILHLYYLGEADSARVWVKKQLQVDPGHYWAFHSLAWAYVGLNSLEKAENTLNHCLEMNPGDILQWYRLAHVKRLRGQHREAAEIFQKITTMSDDEFDAYYQAGICYRLAGDEAAARTAFVNFSRESEKWFGARGKNPDYYWNAALFAARTGNKAAALSNMTRAVRMDSTRYFQHAQLQAVLGNAQQAIDNLEKAVASGFSNFIWMKINPDFLPLHNEQRFRDLIAKTVK